MPSFPWQSGHLEAHVSFYSDEFTADVRLNHRHHFMVFTIMRVKPEKGGFCVPNIPGNDLSGLLALD